MSLVWRTCCFHLGHWSPTEEGLGLQRRRNVTEKGIEDREARKEEGDKQL